MVSRVQSSNTMSDTTNNARFTPVRLELPSLRPSLAVEVLPHGVTLQSILVNIDGKVCSH